ncbi:MAG: Rv2175c family DNA-binding protein [Sporichthyaceae bacterium]
MSVESGQADAAEQTVTQWLTVPEVGELLGLDVLKVRGLLRDRQLLARRRGERSVLQVPADFLLDGVIIKGLPGTLSVLRDNGFSDDEAMRWLFTADDSLPGTPTAALRENRGTEVRRRAQALAF